MSKAFSSFCLISTSASGVVRLVSHVHATSRFMDDTLKCVQNKLNSKLKKEDTRIKRDEVLLHEEGRRLAAEHQAEGWRRAGPYDETYDVITTEEFEAAHGPLDIPPAGYSVPKDFLKVKERHL